MQRKKITSIAAIAIALGAILFVIFTQEDVKQVGTEKGMIATDFTTPIWGVDKNEASLSDYDGDIVVLNFWASWCIPCRDEMPELMKFYDDYKDKGVTVAGVNMHIYERTATDGIDFLEELEVTIPSFLDTEGDVVKTYKPLGFPTTYILNRDRVIETVINGEVNYKMIQELVTPLL